MTDIDTLQAAYNRARQTLIEALEADCPYQPGDPVEVFCGGQWKPAEVTEIAAAGDAYQPVSIYYRRQLVSGKPGTNRWTRAWRSTDGSWRAAIIRKPITEETP